MKEERRGNKKGEMESKINKKRGGNRRKKTEEGINRVKGGDEGSSYEKRRWEASNEALVIREITARHRRHLGPNCHLSLEVKRKGHQKQKKRLSWVSHHLWNTLRSNWGHNASTSYSGNLQLMGKIPQSCFHIANQECNYKQSISK